MEFIRFVFVGGFCYILSFFLLFVFVDFFNVNYLVSMLILWPIVNSVGFFLNKTLTFKKEIKNISSPLFTYNILTVFSFCLTLLVMYLLVSIIGLNYLVANIIVGFTMMFINFYSHKKITFR